MIELEQIKQQIKHTLPESDPTEDELIEEYERAAVAYVQKITGRYYGPPVDDAAITAVGNGTSLLYLHERVSAITSVTERMYLGDTGTVIATGATDGWALRLAPGESFGNAVIRKGGSLWLYGYEYALVGTIGYPAGEEPANVRQAVRWMAAQMYVNRIPVALGTVAPEIALTVRDMLGPEIRIAV